MKGPGKAPRRRTRSPQANMALVRILPSRSQHSSLAENTGGVYPPVSMEEKTGGPHEVRFGGEGRIRTYGPVARTAAMFCRSIAAALAPLRIFGPLHRSIQLCLMS